MPRPLRLFAVTFAALSFGACETTPAITMSQQESQRPRPVRLSPDAQARLEGRFDVGAVEELLGTMTAQEQQDLLASLGASDGVPADGETRDVSVTMHSTDPARQALLDRMWAPFWDHIPSELLDREDLPFPGRKLAKERRDARTFEKGGGKNP